MGKITVKVNGQAFQLACQDGEEARLESLAAYVDEKMASLTASMGQAGDIRLLLMTALLITDELAESRERQGGNLHNPAGGATPFPAATTVDEMSQRIEDIAQRLESA